MPPRLIAVFSLAACIAAPVHSASPFTVTPVAQFSEPWAMSFLPDGRLLVTEKAGKLIVATADGKQQAAVAGVPEVAYGGQGGFGDVVLHPSFKRNGLVYLSYAEAGDDNTRGAAVARARLVLDAKGGGRLDELRVIWRQQPKVTGGGHFGHRIAFAANGDLFISSGERQKFDPAQDLKQNLGKIIRLNDDGSIPKGNPFADQGGVAEQVWSYGQRNPLGLAFDAKGALWEVEMGPRGGDELNRIEKAANYGYPIVSNGDHYDGRMIPDHDTRPEVNSPEAFWNPVISPSSLMIYSGTQFPQWRGNAFIGGLSSQSLVRVELTDTTAREAERFDMGQRIREVEQGPDGAIWLLEDGKNGQGGRLLRLAPASQ